MTDIFEGSIIRAARRLDEFVNQVLINFLGTVVNQICPADCIVAILF